jgi:hypothetical protein
MKSKMGKCKIAVIIVLALTVFQPMARGQSQEITQLLLNVTKLEALNGILKNMEDGWRLVSSGYQAVKDVSEGNFSIHNVFLNNLLKVNPVVRNYRKTGLIIGDQLTIVREYKASFKRFRNAGTFNADEIAYLGRVYDKLFSESLKNLDDLALVITAGQLRMSDEERLELIDGIYEGTQDQLAFLRDFNSRTSVLSAQRHRENNDVLGVGDIYGINQKVRP